MSQTTVDAAAQEQGQEQEQEQERGSSDDAKADHLCVLTHGLWGNPDHLNHLSKSLRERYPTEKLNILLPKSNTGNFTYDGIELGAERVTKEVEDRLEELAQSGHKITKISFVGYSLGGLVARYAIGILYSKGWFDRLEPVNFTTFATPHLGVRTPVNGVRESVWNAIGGRFLSQSGHQLFTIDSFRSTGRPLLCLLADPSSVFIRALSCFRNRALYANIISDRSSPYYTSAFSSTDPFVDLSSVKLNYQEGWDPVILDVDNPVSPIVNDGESLPLYHRIREGASTFLSSVPSVAFLTLVIPIGLVFFVINGGIQSIRSAKRIKLHESGKAGLAIGAYHLPLMIGQQRVQSAMDGAFEDLNRVRSQEYLSESDSDSEPDSTPLSGPASGTSPVATQHAASGPSRRRSLAKSRSHGSEKPAFQTLALSPEQFQMIDALNDVGFRKHLVHVQAVRMSHAAIIVRRDRKDFDEGRRVVKHWLDEEFQC